MLRKVLTKLSFDCTVVVDVCEKYMADIILKWVSFICERAWLMFQILRAVVRRLSTYSVPFSNVILS